MAGEPPEIREIPDGPEPESEAASADASGRGAAPIDLSGALHTAGHEVADLGFEGLPDDGPVVHPEQGHAAPEDPLDFVNVQMPSD